MKHLTLVVALVLAVGAIAAVRDGPASPRYSATDLGTLGGNASVANAINDSGVVVGRSRIAGNAHGHAFVYENGRMRDLGTLGSLPDSTATAITDDGEIRGTAWDEHRTEAFVSSGGALQATSYDPPAVTDGSVVSATAANGDAVGWSNEQQGGGPARAVAFRNGTVVDLGLPRGTESEARGLNGSGEIVGDFFDRADGRQHAFLYDGTAAVDLNSLIDPASGWVLEQATGINDAHAIVGVGVHDGRTRAFLLQLGATAQPDTATPARHATAAPSLQVILQRDDVHLEAIDPAGRAYGTDVADESKLYRSTDEGSTWTYVASFPAEVWYMSALSNGTLLAAVDTGAWTMFRSGDQGVTWTRVLTLPDTPVFYRTLTPHSIAEGDGFVWLGTYNNQEGPTNYVYRSADDGRTWSISNTTTNHKHIHGLAFEPVHKTLYVLFGDEDGDGVWASSDDGVTLSPVCTTDTCIAIDAAFKSAGTHMIFGQDHWNRQSYIVDLDLATGAPSLIRPIPYDSWSTAKLGGTYFVGTTHETGVPITDDLHLFASTDGASTFADVYSTPVPGDATYTLRVQFGFPNGDFAIQVSSEGTIVARLGGGTLGPPASSTPPVVTGTAVQGQTLTTSDGTWTGSPTSYTYAWQRCDTAGNNCTTLAATGNTYLLVAGDVGSTIRAAVTATNNAGSTTATSAATAVVTAGTPGSSFGNPTTGTNWDGGAAGYLDISGPYPINQTASLTRLSGYAAGGTTASTARGLIYTDTNGQPGTLIGATPPVTIAANAKAAWVDYPLTTPITIPAGNYWLGYWYADGNGRHYYDIKTGSERYRPLTYSPTANPPTTFGTNNSAFSNYSILAHYTTAPGAPLTSWRASPVWNPRGSLAFRMSGQYWPRLLYRANLAGD